MHSSHIKLMGQQLIFLTSCWLFPQNDNTVICQKYYLWLSYTWYNIKLLSFFITLSTIPYFRASCADMKLSLSVSLAIVLRDCPVCWDKSYLIDSSKPKSLLRESQYLLLAQKHLQWLVDHNPTVWQTESLAFVPAANKNAPYLQPCLCIMC